MQEKMAEKKEAVNKKLFKIHRKVDPSFSFAQAANSGVNDSNSAPAAPTTATSKIEELLHAILGNLENLKRR